MLNLALNAQDAMVSGGRLTLTTANASLDDRHAAPQPGILPGDYVMVSVIDDGEGMAREVAQRAFEPFYTTKEIGKGSGLGLSMVYGFVKQSDGHIFIQSAPGLGTTVRIYLPRAAEKTARFSERPSHDEAVLPRGTETVLVVEDDPFVRTSVVRRLRDLGYSVVAAVDGNDALGKLRTDIHVDILFTDIVMPGSVNGWELADLAKQIRPGLPVLLTSGYPIETLVQQGRLQAGAVVLAKPYRKEALARRLREILLIGSLSLGSEKPLVSRGSEFDKAK